MPFIWVVNGKRIKRFTFIIVTAFFAAFVAFVQNQQVAVFSIPAKPEAISNVQTERPHVALTFDLSSGDLQIEPLIKILEQQNVKATFFVSGSWAKSHKDLVKELRDNGFEIESGGMTEGKVYSSLKPEEIKQDLAASVTAIQEAGGGRPHFVRPPLGKVSQIAVQEAAKLDQQVVLWNVDPQDYTNPGYESIVSYVMSKATKGSIIRLNATDTSKQTVRALPLIIEGLQEKGLSTVPLSVLITDTTSHTKLVN